MGDSKRCFRGESTNKDNYTLDQKTKSLANIIKEEKQAVQDDVDAINKVKQAHKEEEIAKLKLSTIQKEKEMQIEGAKSFLSTRPQLIKQLEETQEVEISKARHAERKAKEGSWGYNKSFQSKLAQIAESDYIYHLATSRHLAGFEENIGRQSQSSSSSSSSVSSLSPAGVTENINTEVQPTLPPPVPALPPDRVQLPPPQDQTQSPPPQDQTQSPPPAPSQVPHGQPLSLSQMADAILNL